jgi:hypothetical protein
MLSSSLCHVKNFENWKIPRISRHDFDLHHAHIVCKTRQSINHKYKPQVFQHPEPHHCESLDPLYRKEVLNRENVTYIDLVAHRRNTAHKARFEEIIFFMKSISCIWFYQQFMLNHSCESNSKISSDTTTKSQLDSDVHGNGKKSQLQGCIHSKQGKLIWGWLMGMLWKKQIMIEG